jgi:hypothetical protein
VNRCDVIGKRAIPSVMKIIKNTVEPQTLEYTIGLLRNLTRTDANRILIKQVPGAVNDLVQVLIKNEPKVKSGSRNIVVHLLGCLGLLAGNEAMAQDMGKVEQLIPALINTLKNQSEDEAIVTTTLQALQYLAYYHEENGGTMIKQGLQQILTPFISKGGNIAKVSSNLKTILSQNEDNVQDLTGGSQQDADDDSTEDPLAQLITQLRNDDDEDAQFRALQNIWTLASKESNREILRERNIPEEILRVLQTCSYVENIQEGSGCLATMCQDPKTATILSHQNGVPVMARLISVKDEYHIQLYAVTILGLIVILVDEALDEIRRYQMLPRLKNLFNVTMEKLKELEIVEPKNKKVMEQLEVVNDINTYLVRIFASLSREEDFSEELDELGLLDTLIDIVMDGKNVEYGFEDVEEEEEIDVEKIKKQVDQQEREAQRKGLRVAACTALWNMVNNHALKSKIYAREGCAAVMTMMLSDIDLSNSNALLAKKSAGLSEEELANLTKSQNEQFELNLVDMEALKRRLIIQSGGDIDDYDSDLELEPEELEPDELELEPEELQPEEVDLVPEELEPLELEPEALELEPEELQPEEIIVDPEQHRLALEQRELIKKEKEVRNQKRIELEKKRAEKEKRREERRVKKREERRKQKEAQKVTQEKDEETKRKRGIKRLMIMKEMKSTEESYVKALEKMKNEFMQPLLTTKKNLIPQDKIKVIFSDVSILHMINRDFMRELNTLFEDVPALEKNMESLVGDLFLRRASTFKLYSNYVNNYDTAEMTMHECLRKHKPFAEFLEQVSDKLLEQGLRQTDLASHLILPIQRLPRYSLLLSDLIKHSDADTNSSSYAFLQNALLEINRITSFVNESKRVEEFREKANELGQKLGLKWLQSTKTTVWKRTEKKIPYFTYEKFRPTATRSKKQECSLHLLSDTVIIVKEGLGKKIIEIPLANLKCDKKFADKDREGLCAIFEDTTEQQQSDEVRLVYELVFDNRSMRDDIVQQIRNTQLDLKAGS